MIDRRSAACEDSIEGRSTDPPLVSVVIPAFNAARWIRRAVESVLDQTHHPIEVIVVDDGSTDGTAAALIGFGASVSILRQDNLGVSAARNRGIGAAKGSFIALLDADDWWLRTKIERQLTAFEAEPELGLVHTAAVELDQSGNLLKERLEGATGYAAVDMFRHRRGVVAGASSALIRAAVVGEVGGFSSELSTTADWDFFLRVAEHFRIGFVAEPLTAYVQHGSNMHLNLEVARRDMLLAAERALRRRPDIYEVDRRRGVARIHRILAGSYFHQRRLINATWHGVVSLLDYPPGVVDLGPALIRAIRPKVTAAIDANESRTDSIQKRTPIA